MVAAGNLANEVLLWFRIIQLSRKQSTRGNSARMSDEMMSFSRPPTHTLWRLADGSGGVIMAAQLGCALVFVKKDLGACF